MYLSACADSLPECHPSIGICLPAEVPVAMGPEQDCLLGTQPLGWLTMGAKVETDPVLLYPQAPGGAPLPESQAHRMPRCGDSLETHLIHSYCEHSFPNIFSQFSSNKSSPRPDIRNRRAASRSKVVLRLILLTGPPPSP